MSRELELTDDYKKLRGAFQKVFGSPEGERVLDHLRRVLYGDQSTFVPGDSHCTSFCEGKRFGFLEIEKLRSLKDREIEKLVKQKMEGKQSYE